MSPNTRQIKFASINVQSNEYSLISKQPSQSPSTFHNNNAPLGNATLTPLTTGIVSGSCTSHHHGNSGDHHSGSSGKSGSSSKPSQPTTLGP
ncbi:MAG: hypothetical protein WCF23_03240 [Candidatus Nitrosopolaris sp.]